MAPFRDKERERIERITVEIADLVTFIHDSPGGYKLSFDLVDMLVHFLVFDYLFLPSKSESEEREPQS